MENEMEATNIPSRKKMSMYDWLVDHAESLTKSEFGRIMHDPASTDEEIAEALRDLEEAGGYEGLGD
jgi:hypothetical protein